MELATTNHLEQENKRFAVIDAARRNAIFINTYTFSEIETAILLKEKLTKCYDHYASYLSYRSKFITIKFDGARIKMHEELSKIENELPNYVTKVKTKQGIIYRLKKIS